MITFDRDGFPHERVQTAFFRSLNETIYWCERGSIDNPAGSLRTLETRATWSDLDSRSRRVSSIVHDRSFALRKEAAARSPEPPTDLKGGRLLAYFPDQNLFDGMAELETDGFFDSDNIPPFDTWVDIAAEARDSQDGDMLIAWIPVEFVEMVGRGIYVNPEGCILWLDEVDHPITTTLRRLLVLSSAS